MLAHVRGHQPAELLLAPPGAPPAAACRASEVDRLRGAALLDEGHVPPGVGAEPAGVVVGHAGQRRPSSGSAFHSLQATSQALQPMQTEVSVKNPIRGGWSA